MNELEIKRVPFMGTELMAARDADGQIWGGNGRLLTFRPTRFFAKGDQI